MASSCWFRRDLSPVAGKAVECMATPAGRPGCGPLPSLPSRQTLSATERLLAMDSQRRVHGRRHGQTTGRRARSASQFSGAMQQRSASEQGDIAAAGKVHGGGRHAPRCGPSNRERVEAPRLGRLWMKTDGMQRGDGEREKGTGEWLAAVKRTWRLWVKRRTFWPALRNKHGKH